MIVRSMCPRITPLLLGDLCQGSGRCGSLLQRSIGKVRYEQTHCGRKQPSGQRQRAADRLTDELFVDASPLPFQFRDCISPYERPLDGAEDHQLVATFSDRGNDRGEGPFEELKVLELLIGYEGSCGPRVGFVKEEKGEKVIGGRGRV